MLTREEIVGEMKQKYEEQHEQDQLELKRLRGKLAAGARPSAGSGWASSLDMMAFGAEGVYDLCAFAFASIGDLVTPTLDLNQWTRFVPASTLPVLCAQREAEAEGSARPAGIGDRPQVSATRQHLIVPCTIGTITDTHCYVICVLIHPAIASSSC